MGQNMTEHSPDGTAHARSARWRMVVNGSGAVVSVSLVAALIVWGGELFMRDVSGVPVVRAIEGPARVAPETPGGEQVAYQGLAVNAVAERGAEDTMPERLVLAPPPLSLDDDVAPAATLRDAVARTTDPDRAPSDETAADGSEDDAIIAAAMRSASNAVSGRALDDDAGSSANSAAPEGAETSSTEIAGPGPRRSPRPPARPEQDLVAQATANATSMTAQRQVEIDADTLDSGTRLVQVGAFEEVDIAREEWRRLARRFEVHLEDKQRVIQPTQQSGRDFYRLRVHGFADDAEARRFCAVLIAENEDCIPVLLR